MQMADIEIARHVVGWEDANSAEFSGTTKHPVIALMPDQVDVTEKGGTMRLGKYPCMLAEGTRSRALYGAEEISERHRHRFEFNNDFRAELSAKGMTLAGMSPDGRLVEIVELPDHPWFVGAQFHPEFKSRPDRPHPLFYGFVKAAVDMEEALSKDCIEKLGKKLLDAGVKQEELDKIKADAQTEMDEAVKFADESPYPDPAEVTDDMYTADNERCVAR
jgi:hypothetical protein